MALLLASQSAAANGNKVVIAGESQMPQGSFCYIGLNNTFPIRFPIKFKSPPTVVVTQELPSGRFDASDGILSIINVTKVGFEVIRKRPSDYAICLDTIIVNYVAVGVPSQ
jgi:hypothetical protein